MPASIQAPSAAPSHALVRPGAPAVALVNLLTSRGLQLVLVWYLTGRQAVESLRRDHPRDGYSATAPVSLDGEKGVTMSSITMHGASAINLSDPAFWEGSREQRWDAFEALRRELPVAWQPPPVAWSPREYSPPRGYWAITRHDDVKAVSRDSQTFASGPGIMVFDNLPPDLERLYDGILAIDGTRHSQLRRLVANAFTPKMARSLQDWIEGQVRHTITQVSGQGECDFVDLVSPFPVNVICDMLGVPGPDRPELRRLMRLGTHIGADAPADDSIQACSAAVSYLVELARTRRNQPGEDLASALVHSEVEGAQLSDDDIGSVCWVILTGGSEPTAMTATHAMLALARNRADRLRLQADYDSLANRAVEEMLRWGTPVIEFRRTATCDTQIAGQPIAAGDNVVLFYSSANQDETIFDNPRRFDVSRDPNPHLAFGGGGLHFCLGAALARMELKSFFCELFRQLPDFDASGSPLYTTSPLLDEIASLPCSFTPVKYQSNERGLVIADTPAGGGSHRRRPHSMRRSRDV